MTLQLSGLHLERLIMTPTVRSTFIAAAMAVAICYAGGSMRAEPPWHRSQWFDEYSFTAAVESVGRIHVNAAADDGGKPARATRIVVYALPNGNTLEQTLGCRRKEGLDWKYDIQHVAAQVRLLRTLLTNERIVLVCAEANGLSWPNWRRTSHDANEKIARMLYRWRQQFGKDDCQVMLTGHSGGGSFILGVIEGNEKIPDYIDRIAFLDANYSFEGATHADKLGRWLTADELRRLIVLAYDDREITLNHIKVVGPTGGTYRATGRMREAFSQSLDLLEKQAGPFQVTTGLDGRLRFYVHTNPQNKILHTALVGEMNGLVHAATLGTPHEETWGSFGGPRAYMEHVQPEPISNHNDQAQNRYEPHASSPSYDRLPARPVDSVGGKAFFDRVKDMNLDDREAAIHREIISGNFPDVLRRFKSVTIRDTMSAKDPNRQNTATIEVMPDYLAIGSDHDFVRIPMTPQTAQRIADAFGCVLPTRKMVDAIDDQAELHLAPRALTRERESAATFLEHHRIIERQRAGKPLGLLVAGIKKDIVITPRLFERPGRLAIYGWRQLDGRPIQPLTIVHRNRYVDYSHGARLVRNSIAIEGKTEKLTDLLGDPQRCGFVSDEGPMNPPRYPLGE
jgi:hypothetical protein